MEAFYEDFYNVLERSTLKLLKPQMLVTLTGGWDTRVIVGILARNNASIPAFTFGSKLEIAIAGKVAATLNLKHYAYECRVQDYRFIQRKLKKLGCRYLLVGSLFDEVNGGWIGSKARTYEQFKHAQEIAMQQALLQFLEVKNSSLYPEPVSPMLDPNVLAYLNRMPWQLRTAKKIQRWILKHKFPELWRVPYYDSLLPNFMPYLLHGLVTNLHLRILKYP
jgi:asparagine synthetase B (glutamine-hydrolysing)